MKDVRHFHRIRTIVTLLLVGTLSACAYVESLTGRVYPSSTPSTPTVSTTPSIPTTAGTAGKPVPSKARSSTTAPNSAASPSGTLKTPSATAYTPTPMAPVFYDFPDIPTPRELSLVPADSYVLEVGSTRAGLLVLKGRVEINSVMRFFDSAMPREQWNKKGSLRYQKSMLIFEKPDRGCIINIYERNFMTNVEIYVVPYETQPPPNEPQPPT